MRRHRRDKFTAIAGASLAVFLVAVLLPLAVGAQETPQPGPTEATPLEATPVPGPTGATPTPTPTVAPGALSITDTEYLGVQIDETGAPGDAILKDWLRVRGPAGEEVSVVDPGVLDGVTSVSGSPSPDVGNSFSWNVELPGDAFRDLYYEGDVVRDGDMYLTGDGPRPLPIEVKVLYFTGAPGLETQVTAEEFKATRGPAKIVFQVTNKTRQMQEVTYNDVRTKEDVTAVAPVWTPYVVKIGPIRFPDSQFDRIRTDGVATREGPATDVTWTLNLAPPDYDATQTAIAEFLVARPRIPDLRIIAQPQYPPAQAEAVSSEGIQFQKGRRSFIFDVFELLRSNLVALTGLFGLLDDAFSNLALPLISPSKGNREAGSFDNPNQLWAIWTLAKGMEQLDRALNVLDYSLQLSRNAVKGQIATLSQMRLLLGKSTDDPSLSVSNVLDAVTSLDPAEVQELEGVIDEILAGSIWQNIKELELVLGCLDCGEDPNPYLPEAPISLTADHPGAGLLLSVIRLKLSLFEQNLAALQKEDHSNQLATFTGISDTAESTAANDFTKFTTITFPFGLEELDRGLYGIKVNGIDLLQAAIGNKDVPNSIIWAMHVLTDGMEGLSDSFHQLGSTWRYLADSVQNFGIFGVETAQNTLQLDINTIDLESAQRAAAASRVTQQATTFMGSPESTKKVPVDTQFVLAFSTDAPEMTSSSPTSSAGGKVVTLVALLALVGALVLFARFRWFLI